MALTDEQIDLAAAPYAGMGGIENYRAFAREITALEREACARFQESRSSARHGYDKHEDGDAIRNRD